MNSAQKKLKYKKKRMARYVGPTPPARPARPLHRQPELIHRGRIHEAALRAIAAVTSDQL